MAAPTDATDATPSTVSVDGRYAGPPRMGHGGYVAGLFATGTPGAIQVTLRRPTPLDTPLQVVSTGGGGRELRLDDAVIAQAVPAELDLSVPTPPTLDVATAAEAASPAHYNGHGVHPTCFGCGLQRAGDDGLAIAAGPVDARDSYDGEPPQVAAPWQPHASHLLPTKGDGSPSFVAPQFVVAALDCPGAFAFIAQGDSAGLLGRITFEQHADVPGDAPLLVTGWPVRRDGSKMLAGTALFTADGELLASALATWFPFPG